MYNFGFIQFYAWKYEINQCTYLIVHNRILVCCTTSSKLLNDMLLILKNVSNTIISRYEFVRINFNYCFSQITLVTEGLSKICRMWHSDCNLVWCNWECKVSRFQSQSTISLDTQYSSQIAANYCSCTVLLGSLQLPVMFSS